MTNLPPNLEQCSQEDFRHVGHIIDYQATIPVGKNMIGWTVWYDYNGNPVCAVHVQQDGRFDDWAIRKDLKEKT